MNDNWRPEHELMFDVPEAEVPDLLESGMRWCEEHQGYWNPDVWEECPMCFDDEDPMARRQREWEERADAMEYYADE